MTRPEIIRADTVDLQDRAAPSAKDHTRQPTQPAPLGAGPPAPHQAETLREVAAEAADQEQRSPGFVKDWGNAEQDRYGDDMGKDAAGANSQQQDALAVAQNGGLTGSTAEDADMADAEGDDGMDDDMMDKISSSPSIDDGGYSLPHSWPQRSTSLVPEVDVTTAASQACSQSSSPFLDPPDHFPLRPMHDQDVKDVVPGSISHEHHHLRGEVTNTINDDVSNYEDYTMDLTLSPSRLTTGNCYDVGDYEQDYNLDSFNEDLSAGNLAHTRVFPAEEDEELMIPYEPSDEDDDDDANDDYSLKFDAALNPDDRFIDSGWGGECLQELEDIDFEFVYALHTFVATVEGQANATKGDTMVLLDDSNSYWWLVRVVKDSSIGYLPAEHIETPTERLARLNKHRNIDLTSAMLGDQGEKTKNPLKKVIRRRNAKNVSFAPPTYVEASDVDYSTDEDEGEGDFYGNGDKQEESGEQKDERVEEDEITATEPLKPRAEIREVKSDSVELERTTSSDALRSSDEIFEGKMESSKSRNGTVRNTDSFFKDDSVETRKITLTPNLLRDDSSTSTRTSNDSKEFQKRPSLDKLEKDSVSDKKDKKASKEKKDKDKKPGMLSGLFKRKDKKSKSQDDDEESLGKRSTDRERASPVPSKDSEEAPSVEDSASQEIQRQPSKLQKQPRTESSPVRKPGAKEVRPVEPQQAPAPERPPPANSVQAPSMRLVQPENGSQETIKQSRDLSPELTRGATPVLSSPKDQKPSGTISKILRSASGSNAEHRPVKAKKAKARVELDEFDSSEESSPVEEPQRATSKQAQRPIPGSFPDSYLQTPQDERSNAMDERLSESPVEVSPVTPTQSYPPPLLVDSSSQEDPPSPISSPSPDIIDADEAREKKGSSTTSTSTTTWSDTHLRTFFDDEADIKDLLVVVYDKSGVVPAGPDHPVVGNLFREENAKLADITNRLDGMLGDWLARKMRTQGSR